MLLKILTKNFISYTVRSVNKLFKTSASSVSPCNVLNVIVLRFVQMETDGADVFSFCDIPESLL